MKSIRLSQHAVAALQAGDLIPDHEFDEILPPNLNDLSDTQWSSVRATRLLADMIKDLPAHAKVIDLGAGVGKLCLLLALMTPFKIHGIERRKNLLEIAKRLCDANAPERVNLIHGDLLSLNWQDYDVLYLYNPFFEQKCSSASLIDRNIELGEHAFRQNIADTYTKLASLKSGQRVITFHGYGGKIPTTFKLLTRAKSGYGMINMWEQS